MFQSRRKQMPKDAFYDLGKSPKKMNDMDMPEKMRYPMIHDIGVDNYPPLGEMKLGGTGRAEIEFKIAKGGGIEILKMKDLGSSKGPDDTKPKEEKPNGKD